MLGWRINRPWKQSENATDTIGTDEILRDIFSCKKSATTILWIIPVCPEIQIYKIVVPRR